MADAPKNPQQNSQNQGDTVKSGFDQAKKGYQDLVNFSRALLESDGDYLNILKDINKEIDRSQKSYVKIQARLESLNRDSVNIKQVNQELFKLRQKQFIEEEKLKDLQTEYGKKATDILETVKKQALEDQKYYKERGIEFDLEKEIFYNLQQQGNLEAVALHAQERRIELSKIQTKEGEKLLQTEKDVAKNLGLTGKLAKNFADKLGVGQSVYEAMTLQARQNVDAIENGGKKSSVLAAGLKAASKSMFETWNNTSGWGKAAIAVFVTFKAIKKAADLVGSGFSKMGSALKGMSEDSSNVFGNLTSGISSFAKNIPVVGGLISGLIDGFASILDLVVGVDDKIIKAGRQIGLSAVQAKQLNRHFQDLSFNSGNVFTTSKKYLESMVELNKAMGVNVKLTDEQLETNIMLKDLAGVELETRQAITETSTITGRNAKSIATGVLAQVKGLEAATGISFNYQQILKEAAASSGYLGLQFAKYPEKLTKSLVTVKALGMDIKQLDSMADSFLDFESSISKEFEAQLLTGKNINLQKAREAFLNNDLAGAAMEINKQVGSSADFMKLNRIAAESLASSLGMSRDQLGDMLKKQELYSKLGAKEGASQRELLKIGLQRYHNQKELAAALGDEAYQSLVTGSTQEKMAALIEKIKQSVVDFLENTHIIDKIKSFMDYMTNPTNIKTILEKVRGFVATIADVIGTVIAGVARGLRMFYLISHEQKEDLVQLGEGLGNSVRAVGGGLNYQPQSIEPNAVAEKTTASPRNEDATNVSQGKWSNGVTYLNNHIYMDGQKISTGTEKATERGFYNQTDLQTGPYGNNNRSSGQ